MNGFFGVGPLELVVIGVLALIFIGPERLPGVISQVMKTVRELRSYASQVQDELSGEFADIRQDLEGVARDMNQFAGEINSQVNTIATETQDAARSVSMPELNSPPRPATMPELPPPAPAAVGTNGAAPAVDEAERPAFAEYKPE